MGVHTGYGGSIAIDVGTVSAAITLGEWSLNIVQETAGYLTFDDATNWRNKAVVGVEADGSATGWCLSGLIGMTALFETPGTAAAFTLQTADSAVPGLEFTFAGWVTAYPLTAPRAGLVTAGLSYESNGAVTQAIVS